MSEGTILVVGAGSGIGRAVAVKAIEAGRPVIAAVRDASKVADLGIETLPFDAETPPQWQLPEKLGGLVYCPGSILLKPFHRLSDEEFLRDFEINCMGAVRSIRAALPALKASGCGSIVLFSTVAVAQGMPFHASIATAKAAIEGLARSLAAELAPAIRVNVIAPSLTDTPLAATLLNTDPKREAAAKRHPLQNVGAAADVASLVMFLLGSGSGFMTGQVLRPDGGLSSVRTFA
ncbi:MAG: SDR family oxidoreductase [Akkermansiaceae bacterium]|jgi:NAD(P)-dependent dehydrogenase (short-subunit alcohol dehydrogenase family)|nr:SDR family oxidoreductase [Akkermansiaceae bacterium]